MDTQATQLRPSRAERARLGKHVRRGAAVPGAAAVGILFPLFGGGYWGVIATRACVYWVLVSGLNLVVGFAGQIAIGWVALLTLGAYTTSVLAAGNVTPALPPYLALAIAAVVGAIFGLIVGLPALRLRTFYFAITTLGFATIVTQVALAWQSVTGGGVGVAGPIFPAPFDLAVGLLLFLLRPGRDLHLDDGEYRGKPLRPRADRDPRCGGRGRSQRHLQAGSAGHGVPVQRRRCRRLPAGCSPRCNPTSRPTRSRSTCRSCSSSPS